MFGVYRDDELIARFSTPLTIKSNVPVFTADSVSLKRNIVTRSGQRWEIEGPLEPINQAANELFTLLVTTGFSTPYKIGVPTNYAALNKTVVRAAEKFSLSNGDLGASKIYIKAKSFIPKGTFITFEDHSKVYMTTEDRDKEGEVGIFPRLRSSFKDMPTFWKAPVFGKFYLDTDQIQGVVYTDGILVDNGSMRFVEVV